MARNLFLQDQRAASSASVADEVDRIKRYRDFYSKVPIFLNRSVVFAASSDTMRDGRNQFGHLANRVVIRREALRFFFFRGHEYEGPDGEAPALERVLAAETA